MCMIRVCVSCQVNNRVYRLPWFEQISWRKMFLVQRIEFQNHALIQLFAIQVIKKSGESVESRTSTTTAYHANVQRDEQYYTSLNEWRIRAESDCSSWFMSTRTGSVGGGDGYLSSLVGFFFIFILFVFFSFGQCQSENWFEPKLKLWHFANDCNLFTGDACESFLCRQSEIT